MTKVMAIVNLHTTNGEELGDQRVVEKVLRSLPTKYEMIKLKIKGQVKTKLYNLHIFIIFKYYFHFTLFHMFMILNIISWFTEHLLFETKL